MPAESPVLTAREVAELALDAHLVGLPLPAELSPADRALAEAYRDMLERTEEIFPSAQVIPLRRGGCEKP